MAYKNPTHPFDFKTSKNNNFLVPSQSNPQNMINFKLSTRMVSKWLLKVIMQLLWFLPCWVSNVALKMLSNHNNNCSTNYLKQAFQSQRESLQKPKPTTSYFQQSLENRSVVSENKYYWHERINLKLLTMNNIIVFSSKKKIQVIKMLMTLYVFHFLTLVLHVYSNLAKLLTKSV